ncbi:hypothetical protein CPB84DRAFT_1798042 [Gymnopilus junonius]|uniref:BTB domain-containing protein n=1 Tax=Gymnopilus junonius TaxID=109634 RepID=A0A9P5TFE3_GYMJU|nr:hypothetical protein CPB84DRAFT_1798042 [Gymnopilus junonius]
MSTNSDTRPNGGQYENESSLVLGLLGGDVDEPLKTNENLKNPDSEPNKKRKFEEGSETGKPLKKRPTYTKDDTYYLPDGNVLLQIGQVRFKLHKSRLSSQSQWFRFLFTRKACSLLGDDFQDHEEIDQVISTADTVDGYDLFYLDLPGVPQVSQFVELLTCMDNAITYLKKEPTFPTINDILQAAYFFHFDSFSTPLDMLENIVCITPHAVEAVNLGILRCAMDKLEDLPRKDLILLLKVQKELVLTWDSIIPLTEHICDEPDCMKIRTVNSAITWRKKHPFDPIYVIHKLIKQDWLAKGFCLAKEKEAIAKLKVERSKIWANLKIWLELEDELV